MSTNLTIPQDYATGVDTMMCRVYEGGSDYHLINAWHKHHTGTPLQEITLPPLGVVVCYSKTTEPIAALWAHLSTGIGIAFLEEPVSVPGLTPNEATRAFGVAIGAITLACRKLDYGMLQVTAKPGLRRVLERAFNFVPASDADLTRMVKRI